MQQVLSYGGGRQTVAILLLIAQGRLPRPDRIVIADTGREKRSTWEYREQYAEPIAQSIGLTIEIAPRSLAYVDLYGINDALLLPVYTPTSKLSAFCSTEWKAWVVYRYMKMTALGYTSHQIAEMTNKAVRSEMKSADAKVTGSYTSWIGFAYDERRRVKGEEHKRYPLIDAMLTKADCQRIILDAGLPLPLPSSCWMCPNMTNAQWRDVRDQYPNDFQSAIELDREIREENIARGMGPIYLHISRVPLEEADLDADDGRPEGRQCGLGMCFV